MWDVRRYGVRHVGLPAKSLTALAAFYCDVLGMKITRENSPDARYGVDGILRDGPAQLVHIQIRQP